MLVKIYLNVSKYMCKYPVKYIHRDIHGYSEIIIYMYTVKPTVKGTSI